MYISARTSSGLKPDVLGANSSGHGLSGWRRFVKNAAIHRSGAFTFLAEAVVPRGHWCPGGLWESVGAGLGFHDDGDRDWPLLGGSHTCKVPHGHRTVPPRCQSTPVQTHWGGYSQLLGRFLCKQGPPPSLQSRVPRPQCYGHLVVGGGGAACFPVVGAVLRRLGYRPASLPPPTRPLDARSTLRVVTANNDSRHSQMSPDGPKCP